MQSTNRPARIDHEKSTLSVTDNTSAAFFTNLRRYREMGRDPPETFYLWALEHAEALEDDPRVASGHCSVAEFMGDIVCEMCQEPSLGKYVSKITVASWMRWRRTVAWSTSIYQEYVALGDQAILGSTSTRLRDEIAFRLDHHDRAAFQNAYDTLAG